MRSIQRSAWVWFAVGIVSAGLFLPVTSSAQGIPTDTRRTTSDNTLTQTDSERAGQQLEDTYLGQTMGDPKEEAAYQAFHKTSEEDMAKKVKLANAFLAKYPGDRYTEAVYEELSQTYYDMKNLPDFYTFSAKGLSLFPDDVHLLALSGWVIPRAFTTSDPEADKRLE